MAVPTTWTELKAELAALAIRDDLTELIPNFIGYAENWFQRELFSPEREETATLTVTAGSATLPADFGGVKMVYVDGTTDHVLNPMTAPQLRASYPTTTTGTPAHFAIEGETILFGPHPASSDTIKLKYVEGITALGDAAATNWLLTDHPDLYVNASLAELYAYTRDPEGEAYRRGKALAIANSINVNGRRRRANSGPLAATHSIASLRGYQA
jgi:hypothetical protein